MRKAVVLLTGGIQSTTVLAYAKSCGMDVHTLFVNCSDNEMFDNIPAANVSAQLKATSHHVATLSIQNNDSGKTLGLSYDRPMVLAYGFAYAKQIGANLVLVGDSRHKHGQADAPLVRELLSNALDTTYPEDVASVSFISPLWLLDDAAVVKWGVLLGTNYQRTFVCQNNRKNTIYGRYAHCGYCNDCIRRRTQFAEAGVSDPGEYEVGKS